MCYWTTYVRYRLHYWTQDKRSCEPTPIVHSYLHSVSRLLRYSKQAAPFLHQTTTPLPHYHTNTKTHLLCWIHLSITPLSMVTWHGYHIMWSTQCIPSSRLDSFKSVIKDHMTSCACDWLTSTWQYSLVDTKETVIGKKSSGMAAMLNSMLPVLLEASMTGSLHWRTCFFDS